VLRAFDVLYQTGSPTRRVIVISPNDDREAI
jgi:hypothetical protein